MDNSQPTRYESGVAPVEDAGIMRHQTPPRIQRQNENVDARERGRSLGQALRCHLKIPTRSIAMANPPPPMIPWTLTANGMDTNFRHNGIQAPHQQMHNAASGTNSITATNNDGLQVPRQQRHRSNVPNSSTPSHTHSVSSSNKREAQQIRGGNSGSSIKRQRK